MNEHIPDIETYIKRLNWYLQEHYPANKKITAEEWNALFLALINQGNAQEDTLAKICNEYLPLQIEKINTLVDTTNEHEASIAQLRTDTNKALKDSNYAVITADTALNQVVEKMGTVAYINNVLAPSLHYTRDPQAQLDDTAQGIINLQSQIDLMEQNTNVADVVGTFVDLVNYDKSKLTANDIVEVLQDETRANADTYYRLVENDWVYIGKLGSYYTRGESDALLAEKINYADYKDTLSFAESERQKSKNLFNKDLLKKGCYIFVTGKYEYSGEYMTSEPISVTPNSIITVSCNGFTFNSNCGFVFFNNGVYVGYLSNGATVATVPANANQVIYDFYKVGITKDDLQYAQLEYGSVATDYQPYYGQITHNGDSAVEFAEKEYQKSKNLIPYPYHDGNSIVSNGITFTVNNDQSISVSGTIIDHNSNAVMWLAWDMPLKVGTYRISDSNSSNDLSVVAWIGNNYYQKDVNNGMFTLSSDTTAKIYIQVAKGSTKTYNDTVKFMLCEGTDTDWQPYNGAIVHEKEFHETLQNTPAIAFAESERQKSKNLCGLIDFEQTVNGVTIRLVSSSQTVVLNGTATSTFDAMTTVRNMLPYVSNMQGEDLKVSAYYLSGTKSDTAIAFISTVDNDNVFGDRSAGISLPDSGITSINFSPSKNSTYNTLMLYTVNGASFTNYMFRIQIEKGQVTNWEYPHGPISHNKELDDVAVSNNAFDLSIANANSYQSVFDLLRVNKGVGNFYFAGNDFPSFLPPCPDDVWHGTGNIDQIVVKIDTNNFTKSLSMTLQGINQNTPAYKLDAYFDGTNWRNSGWYKPEIVELIYDKDTKNTIGGKPYTAGIKSGTIIDHDFSQYKKLILTVYRNNVGCFDYEINLEYLDYSGLYGGAGITYSFQAQDNYFVYSSARISADKQTMVYVKSGYTETFFETMVSTNDVLILRIKGVK